MKLLRVLGMLGMLAVVPATAHAATIVLDFKGLGNFEPVLNFYDGGLGGSGSGPGPDHNIQFTQNALAIIDADAGGTGNFANEPSPNTILFFLTGSAVMNVIGGFDTGFSFFYAAANLPGSVTVYDGPNATGNVLASLNLAVNGSSCGGDPNGDFNCWTPIGVTFTGTAQSVDFGGTVNQIGFDNITLGSSTPGGDVPEPAMLALFGLAAIYGTAASRRRV